MKIDDVDYIVLKIFNIFNDDETNCNFVFK